MAAAPERPEPPAPGAEPAVTRWLRGASPLAFSLYAATAAFATYFCMYSYRKAFAAGHYDGPTLWIFDLKSALVVSQVCGYALSKAIGVKFNSELSHRRRAVALVVLIVWAELALVAFALVPPAGKVVALFFNGLPLGAVWGIVFSFLEGRRTSEILGAGLSCSYIVASGAVKSVGAALLVRGVDELWMPAVTGALFLPLFLVAVHALRRIPAPSAADVAERTARAPMDARERRAFSRRFWPGLSLLIVVYLLLTSYRDFRDNYAAEIWRELGMGNDPAVFTRSEVPIAFAVLAILAALYRVRDNRLGLAGCYAIMIAGSVLIGASTLLFDAGAIEPMTWMIAVGLGLYLGYVPYGCVLFDRTIASLGVVATAVFLIYVSDAFAYAGSVAAILVKLVGRPEASMLDFFRAFSYVTSAVTATCTLAAAAYFLRRARPAPSDPPGS